VAGPAAPVRVAIALGSNLGDREEHLAHAITRLSGMLTDVRVSSFYNTPAEGVTEPQPDYLNAALSGMTTLPAVDLLEAMLAIERERGRSRPSFRASRTLDLDLIFYGDQMINTPELTVPHARWRERAFVTTPLAEVWDLSEPSP
jgi:2-amino-4-hydroxy-6-hydroxymethyldihydropteridine diphosphokinase